MVLQKKVNISFTNTKQILFAITWVRCYTVHHVQVEVEFTYLLVKPVLSTQGLPAAQARLMYVLKSSSDYEKSKFYSIFQFTVDFA